MRAKKFQFPPKQSAIQKTQSAGHVADKHGDEQMSIDSMFKTAGSKMMDRLFRKADGVVWDAMTGGIGVVTSEGIVTCSGNGDEAMISINPIESFALPVPAFAQSTPKNGVQVGDIIYRGPKADPAWVVEKVDKPNGDISFKLLKANGEKTSWSAPKIAFMGFGDGGVMVLRSLVNMLPGGSSGLGGMQGMLMMMAMNEDGGEMNFDKLMPMLLMQSMGGFGNTDPANAANPMAAMMPFMMMNMFKKS